MKPTHPSGWLRKDFLMVRRPQLGHAIASVDTCLPQSGQLKIAIGTLLFGGTAAMLHKLKRGQESASS